MCVLNPSKVKYNSQFRLVSGRFINRWLRAAPLARGHWSRKQSREFVTELEGELLSVLREAAELFIASYRRHISCKRKFSLSLSFSAATFDVSAAYVHTRPPRSRESGAPCSPSPRLGKSVACRKRDPVVVNDAESVFTRFATRAKKK